MLKIAHITPSFYPAVAYGGPIRSTLQLNQSLARAGCDVRVLTTNAGGKDATVDVDTRAPVLFEPRLSVRYMKRLLPHSVAPSLLTAIPEFVDWADVVHLTGIYNFTSFPTLAVAKRMHKPLVWSPRGGLQRWAQSPRRGAKAAFEWVSERLLPEVTLLHVTSEAEAADSSARIHAYGTRIVPNGVFVPDEPPTHVPSSELRVLFLGRLNTIKAIEHLIDACAKLYADSACPFRLSLAGAGTPDYEAALRKRVQERGLGGVTQFLGNVPDADKEALFASHDVLVLPSFKENFGMVVAEALAYGLPVIASQGTPWQVVEERSCGLWVDNSPASLAEALRQMANLDRQAMGKRGHALMTERYAWPSIARAMTRTYEEAIAAQQRMREAH